MRLFAFNADFRLDAEAAERLSPVNLAPRIGAPLVIAVGAEESGEFVRQSRDLWDAWPDVRPPSSHGPMIVPGRHHFSVVDALAEPGHPLHRAALDLLG
jgi:arylformamidase